jgi:hypothetical protein
MKSFIPGVAFAATLASVSLLAQQANASTSPSDFSGYQKYIDQEISQVADPDDLMKIATGIINGDASIDLKDIPGTHGLPATMFPDGLSPLQALTLVQKIAAGGVLSKQQLAQLQKMIDDSKNTTLKNGDERDRAHDVLMFAQLDYHDQERVCENTRQKEASAASGLMSFISSTVDVLQVPTDVNPKGLANLTRAEAVDHAAEGRPNNQEASPDCQQVFTASNAKDLEMQDQNFAIEQINAKTPAGADAGY